MEISYDPEKRAKTLAERGLELKMRQKFSLEPRSTSWTIARTMEKSAG